MIVLVLCWHMYHSFHSAGEFSPEEVGVGGDVRDCRGLWPPHQRTAAGLLSHTGPSRETHSPNWTGSTWWSSSNNRCRGPSTPSTLSDTVTHLSPLSWSVTWTQQELSPPHWWSGVTFENQWRLRARPPHSSDTWRPKARMLQLRSHVRCTSDFVWVVVWNSFGSKLLWWLIRWICTVPSPLLQWAWWCENRKPAIIYQHWWCHPLLHLNYTYTGSCRAQVMSSEAFAERRYLTGVQLLIWFYFETLPLRAGHIWS